MFNRFTQAAMQAMRHAETSARAMGQTRMTAGHLLFGTCTADRDVAAVLKRHGIDPDALGQALSTDGFPPLSASDVDALARIGIDVDSVGAALHATPPPAASAEARVAVAPSAKTALRQAFELVKGSRGRPITPALVAACCLDDPGVHALVDTAGADPAQLHAALLALGA